MRRVLVALRFIVFFSALSFAGLASASACGTGKLLFEDKFAALNPAWGFGPTDPARSNGPQGLVYKFQPDVGITLLNEASLYNDYEICGVFTTQGPADGGLYVGLQFWADDKNNYYEVDVYPVYGLWTMLRVQNGKFLQPVQNQASAAIVKGINATNELRVTVVGSTATIVINGKKMMDFAGFPPQGGSLFGISLGTEKQDTDSSILTVKDFQLREPSAAPATAK
jgi:hypothetical protein